MNNILTVWSKIEETFWSVLGIVEDVREKVEDKLHAIKSLIYKAVVIEVSMLVILLIAIFINKPGVAIFATVGSVLLIWVAYLLSAAIKDVLLFAAKMLPKSTDKEVQAERKAGLEKVELNFLKFTNSINHVGMAITVLTAWMLTFGFGGTSLTTIGMVIVIILFSVALGFFSKKETIWPRQAMIVAMAISVFFWFTTLDNTVSRTIASYTSIIKIAGEEQVDRVTSAITKCDGILYEIDQDGNLVEKDTVIIGTAMRLTNVTGETKRFDGESFTKVIVPNESGKYARGKRLWIQTSCLHVGVKFYPNANKPEYAMAKERIGMFKELRTIYFLTDKPITFPVKRGVKFSFVGSDPGIYGINSNPHQADYGKMGLVNYAGAEPNIYNDIFCLQAKKGTIAKLSLF